jgi:hypothetical protein
MAPVVHEGKPTLFDGILGQFRLSRRDRIVALTLVRLARFTPVVALMARWHRSRGGPK